MPRVVAWRADAERPLDECEHVSALAYLRVRRPARAVAGGRLHPEQDRGVASLRALKRGRELEGVRRNDAVVVVPGEKQRRRIPHAFADVVERRVRAQPPVLLGVVGVSEVGRSRPADRELVEPQHVEHPHLGDGGTERLGVLGD